MSSESLNLIVSLVCGRSARSSAELEADGIMIPPCLRLTRECRNIHSVERNEWMVGCGGVGRLVFGRCKAASDEPLEAFAESPQARVVTRPRASAVRALPALSPWRKRRTSAQQPKRAAHRRAPVAAAAAVGLAPLERGPRLLELAQVALVVLVGESDEAAQRLARLLTLGGCGSGLGVAVRAE